MILYAMTLPKQKLFATKPTIYGILATTSIIIMIVNNPSENIDSIYTSKSY